MLGPSGDDGLAEPPTWACDRAEVTGAGVLIGTDAERLWIIDARGDLHDGFDDDVADREGQVVVSPSSFGYLAAVDGRTPRAWVGQPMASVALDHAVDVLAIHAATGLVATQRGVFGPGGAQLANLTEAGTPAFFEFLADGEALTAVSAAGEVTVWDTAPERRSLAELRGLLVPAPE